MPQAISNYSGLSQTDSQVNKYLFGINSINKNKQNDISTAYAKKGEPMYQKEMDTDDDGIITIDEFKKYCDDNDISVAQRKQMLKDRINWHLMNKTKEASEEIEKEEPKTEKIFAEKGDKEYQEEIDADGDGKITYEEYIKYCEEHEAKNKKQIQNDESEAKQDITTKKAIKAYTNSEPESKIETEG